MKLWCIALRTFLELRNFFLTCPVGKTKTNEMRHLCKPLHLQQVPRRGMFSNLVQIMQITPSRDEQDEVRRDTSQENVVPRISSLSRNKVSISSLFSSSSRKADVLSSLCNEFSRRPVKLLQSDQDVNLGDVRIRGALSMVSPLNRLLCVPQQG